MQKVVIVIFSRDVEAVFITGKTVLSANHVVIVFSIQLERICKHKGSRRVLWLKQSYFMCFAARLL